MTATVTDLNAAETGARIAVISRTHDTARADLERLAPLAGPDATIRRAKDHTAITYTHGTIRWFSALGTGLRGASFDRIHLDPDAATDDAITNARHALAPHGELYIGAQLVDDERDDAGQ